MSATILYHTRNNNPETGYKASVQPIFKTPDEETAIHNKSHARPSASVTDQLYSATAGSCVICVGSTGAGKSSTVTKYTGVVTRSGSGTERVTRHCHLIRDLRDDAAPVWVDTVGWDDAECDDEETFKDILRFINDHDITRVAAIIWNVVPNVRRDALLSKQARLINLFKDEEIWRNVVIVAKQSLNPEADCAGAVRAAEEHSGEWPVLHTGYRSGPMNCVLRSP